MTHFSASASEEKNSFSPSGFQPYSRARDKWTAILGLNAARGRWRICIAWGSLAFARIEELCSAEIGCPASFVALFLTFAHRFSLPSQSRLCQQLTVLFFTSVTSHSTRWPKPKIWYLSRIYLQLLNYRTIDIQVELLLQG
jgi:hypothetical protein